jgi:NADPH2:quinone reductase
MTKAIRFHRFGGPEVLQCDDIEVPPPGAGEVRIRHAACGLNFIDTYQRSGLYPVPLPAIVGNDAAGTVEAIGAGVSDFKPGDRVAYAMGLGAACEVRNMDAARVVALPDDIAFEQAAAMMLRGMTVQYLIRRTYRVQPGDVVLLHAAAGGVGLIACQWLRALGAVVIGTAGSDEKCALALRHGAHHCINYQTQDFTRAVRELTDGKGVAVVYDSVGQRTFAGSLDCLRPLGMMVSYGNASGPVQAFSPAVLAQKGSLFLTRPTLATYIHSRSDLLATAAELFEVVSSGVVRIEIAQRYPLNETAEAHRQLEARATIGSTVLLP